MVELSPSKDQIVRWLLTTFIFVAFGLMFLPFFTPLLMAALFAFALDPYVSKLSREQKVKRKIPTAVFLASLFILILLPVGIVISRIIAKSQELSQSGLENIPLVISFEKFLNQGTVWLSHMSSNLGMGNISENVSGLAPKAAGWVLGLTTAMAAQLPEIILGIFIFSAALYYFLTQSRVIKKNMRDFELLKQDQLDRIIQVVQRSSYVTLITTAIIGSVQAAIVSIAAWFCGYTEFFIVFLLTFFMSLIPVIGAAPMALVLALLSFVQGEVGPGIVLLITAMIAGSIDNVLKPLMVSSQDDDIHPVISLIALIGAVIIYGFPGLLLGPVLTQLSFKIIPILFMDPKFTKDSKTP